MNPARLPNMDRRSRPRLEVQIAARAFPGDIACEIVNISWDGLMVVSDQAFDIADAPIIVEWENGMAHDCVAVWHGGNGAGMRIIRSCLLTAHTPTPFADAKDTWLTAKGLIPLR